MMDFGPISGGFGGISSSSSSNLSALAPPFTVDRSNPNFNTNPLLHYSDSPFNLKWQYVLPSAPGPELVTDSIGDSGVHISDGYRFSATSSVTPSSANWSATSPGTKASASAFTYGGGEINPYYSSYASPLVGEDNSLVPNQVSHYNAVPTSGISQTSQVDYAQSSFDLEYGPRWVDSLGVNDGNRAKRVELEGSFLYNKGNVSGSGIHNQHGQGGYMGTRNKSKEASDFLYQKTEFPAGVGYLENKDIVQNFGFFPNDHKKPNILGPSSMYKDSHSLIPSCEIHNDVSNYQSSYSPYDIDISNYQSSYTPYDKCAGATNTPFTVPSSVMRSSTVVIRPPPGSNVDFGQSTVSRKPTQGNNGEGIHIIEFGHSNSSKQKGIGIESSCKINDDNSGTDLINFSKQGDGLVTSTSVKEPSSVLDSAGTADHKVDTKFVPRLPDLIVSGGTAEVCDDNVTSDFVDALNLGVDSPCWKGAPYSKISQFDVVAGNIKNVENFGEYNGFDLEANQSLYSIIGSDGVCFEKTAQGSMKNQNENGRTNGVFKMEKTLDTLCTSNVQSLLDAKSNLQISTATNIKGVKIGGDADMLRRKSSSPNDLSGFDVKECNINHFVDEKGAGVAPIYCSEGGDVAVHAAEKVLDSPVSEDAMEHPKLPDPKLSMPTVIKTIHNLSELLLFDHSNHADFLDGENTETLKHIKANIDSCLSKKVIQTSDKPESDKPDGDMSEKVEESSNVGIISESHATNEIVDFSIKLNSGSMHEGVETCGASKITGEKFLKLSPFMDDVDMTRDDDMVKAIKKVLEENFHSDEEMHSQALIYKNLWLEAEAKLCSISYKARFDRMKMQMEDAKFKVTQPQVAASNAQPKAGDGTIPKSTIQDCGHTGDIEASVMERFNSLKSREENPKPVNVEEEQGTEMVGGAAVMARFNLLKLHEGSPKLISIVEEDEEESKRIGGEHASSVMARFNVLKSREDNSSLVSVGNEPPPEAVDGSTAEGLYSMQYIGGQSENEAFNTARVPHFQYHTSIGLDEGRFGSFGEEFHLPVKNDAAARFFYHSNIRRQGSFGSHDGSSDWEHVRKDDLSWKTHE